MPTGTLQIRAISGHPGPEPGRGVQREEEVCKYIDVTTCIGCKACEVACVEWNDMPFQQTSSSRWTPRPGIGPVWADIALIWRVPAGIVTLARASRGSP